MMTPRATSGRMLAAGMACAMLAAATGPALAAGGPPLMPTRDATVTYAVTPEGAPQPQIVRVYFQGGGGLMRIDGPPGPDGTPSGDMVMNRSARTMTVVLNQPRQFMDIPERDEVRSPFVLDASMRFTPNGAGAVAGLPCTRYSIVLGAGKADACVTADGVVLSESGVDGQGNRGSLVAQSVSYGPLPATLFVPPPGFQRTTHPEGMGPPPGAAGDPSGPMMTAPSQGQVPGQVQGPGNP